ncbi:MAG: restriction endonuclease subunit S [Verrucomicrobiota bacterium]
MELKPLVQKHHPKKDIADYHQAIIGIEKEYRLSKIAKVSAFMYQQPGIQICYGDALVARHASFPGIANGKFALLAANPPFSVRGFLETLPEEERARFRLTDTINDLDTANCIETFFIERAAQLLKSGGVVALILPASILSNGGSAYVRARELLLQSFDIVAIAEFGSGTFGKTGTNTVTTFLRRKATNPDTADHYRERVEEWFSGPQNDQRKQAIYQDEELIDAYAARIGIDAADYKTLLCAKPNATLLAKDTFAAYRRAFDTSTEVRNLRKQKKFKELSQGEQQAELAKRFMAFMVATEKDKLTHFVLAHEQPNDVLVMRSPNETKEIRKLLGYEWSSTKGDEGIKLTKDAQDHHLTPLYDQTNRDNPAKLNYAIAQNFLGTLADIPTELESYVSLLPLVELLDFSRVVFEKQIGLAAKKKFVVQSKWPLARLAEVAKIVNGGTPDTDNPEFWTGGTICWATLADTKSKYLSDTQRKITQAGLKHTNRLPVNTVIFSSRATIGEVCINKVPTATNQGYKSFICDAAKIDFLYLYHLLVHLRPEFENLVPSGSKYKEINGAVISDCPIPLPPSKTQQQIITDCEVVDKAEQAARATITEARETIENNVNAIYASLAPRLTIDEVSKAVQYGLSKAMNEGGVGYKIFRMNEIAHGRMVDNGAMKYADITPAEFAALKLNRGDVLFNRTNSIEHVGKTGLFDLAGDYCFASYLVRVVPDTAKVLPAFLTEMMNSAEFQTEAKGKASKSINQANINATIMRNMKVPIPSLAVPDFTRLATGNPKNGPTLPPGSGGSRGEPGKGSERRLVQPASSFNSAQRMG